MAKFGKTDYTWPGGTVLTQKVVGSNPVEIAGETPVTLPQYSEGVSKAKQANEEWDRCYICGFTFPKSEFEYYQGKAYCVENGCNKDITQLRRR